MQLNEFLVTKIGNRRKLNRAIMCTYNFILICIVKKIYFIRIVLHSYLNFTHKFGIKILKKYWSRIQCKQ